MVKVFATGPRDRGSIPDRVIAKILLVASFFICQQTELLLLCMLFYPCSYSDFFSHLAFLIICSHIVFNSTQQVIVAQHEC